MLLPLPGADEGPAELPGLVLDVRERGLADVELDDDVGGLVEPVGGDLDPALVVDPVVAGVNVLGLQARWISIRSSCENCMPARRYVLLTGEVLAR